jgi:hypothetical protein
MVCCTKAGEGVSTVLMQIPVSGVWFQVQVKSEMTNMKSHCGALDKGAEKRLEGCLR